MNLPVLIITVTLLCTAILISQPGAAEKRAVPVSSELFK